MPAVLIAIVTLIARHLIARLLIGAGLAVISFSFINSLCARLENELRGYLYSIPSDFLYIIQALKFDFYLSVVISAYSLAISIKTAKIFIGKA